MQIIQKPWVLALGLLLSLGAGSALAAGDRVRSDGLAADTPIGASLFAGSPLTGAMRAGPTRLVALDSGAATAMTRPVRAAIDRALNRSLEQRGLLAPADQAARFRLEPTVYDLTLERSKAALTLRLAFGYTLIDTASPGHRYNDIFHVRVPVQRRDFVKRSIFRTTGALHPAARAAIRQALNGVVANLLAYDRRLETSDPLRGFRLD